MATPNLFKDAGAPPDGERFDTLLQHKNLHIERIVSSAVVTAETFTQLQDEWVLLVQGEADLEVDGTTHTLTPGDHLFLPAGTPHTVRQTKAGTVWLAVHLHPAGATTPPNGRPA